MREFIEGLLRVVYALGCYVRLVVEAVVVACRRPPTWSLVRDQFYNIGVLSLPVVAITGFSTGLVLAVQSFFQLSDKGFVNLTGLMVTKAMITELGPVLTAFMVTGRVGAAMCAELGTMRVSEQIDALKSMAVDPSWYLIAPRFIGGIVMVPILTIFSGVMGVVGAYLLAVYFFGMTPHTFFEPIPNHISNFDFFTGFIKSFFFGVWITTISCYKGMKTKGGAAGVGRSTTNSVVITYSMILLSNFLITLGLNIVHKRIEGF
ncbi:ABC transporter permease [Simkania negevensis]|uniref:ABC transporter permease n=1 Tax=Simkania negevensis TaxID=83561 RepID=A0ABS3AQB1_9BACT|nr:ABC transporter permease [Simkania negevensis]